MKLGRREFVRFAATGVATFALAGCGEAAPGTDPYTPYPAGDGVVASSDTATPEPPASDERGFPPGSPSPVAPSPDADRLPVRPLVVHGNDGVGSHGGVLRRPLLQTTFDPSQPRQRTRALGLRGDPSRLAIDALEAHALLTYDHDLRVAPHLCEWWEYDGEGEWRLLVARQGLRGPDPNLPHADETGGLGLQPLSQLYWGPA